MLSLATCFSAEKKKVLYLNSYHIGMKWSDEITKAISDTFQKYYDVELYIEYLDTKRFSIEEVKPNIDFIIYKKYKNHTFDLIIVSDDNGLQYIIDNYDHFKNTPVIFVGINKLSRVRKAVQLGMTGLAEVVSFRKTIHMIVNLQPDIEKIIIVSDYSSTSKLHLELIKPVYKNTIFKKVQFEEYTDWSWDEAVTYLNSHNKQKTAVIILSWNIDWRRIPVPSNNQFKRMKEIKIPAYSLWKDNVVYGDLVGGYVADGYMHGIEISKRALKILHGVPIDSIPLESTGLGNRPIINYKKLLEYEFFIERVPVNSVFINRSPSFYDDHYSTIWLWLTFIFIQVVLIIVFYIILQDRNRMFDLVKKERRKFLSFKQKIERENICKTQCPNIDEVFYTLSSVLNNIRS